MVLISGDKFEEEEVEVEVEVPGLDPVPVEVVVGEEGEGVAVEEEGGVVCVCGLKGSHGINLTLTFNVPVRFYK